MKANGDPDHIPKNAQFDKSVNPDTHQPRPRPDAEPFTRSDPFVKSDPMARPNPDPNPPIARPDDVPTPAHSPAVDSGGITPEGIASPPVRNADPIQPDNRQ